MKSEGVRKRMSLVTKAVFFVLCFGFLAVCANADMNGCRVTKKATKSTCNEFTFDATSSYDPNNKKITVDWDFGDGTTSDQPVVKHTYEKAGEYVVTLKVTSTTADNYCGTATTTQNVKVNLPPHAAFTSAEGMCTGQSVVFDASSSTATDPSKMTYMWDFGDGTQDKGQSVTKVYKKAGDYRVRLVVDDGQNSACSQDVMDKTIRINGFPVADAGKDMDICFTSNEPMKVLFNGSMTRNYGKNPLTYAWDFGDGAQGSGEKVEHTYERTGNYTAKLMVNDNTNSSCGSDTATVKVSLHKAPLANAGGDVSACLSEAVSFDGSGSSAPAGSTPVYHWDFGDGTSADGMQATHLYQKGGTYRSVLTVNDGTGSKCAVSTDVKNVTVSAPPMAKLEKVGKVCVGDRVNFDASGSRDPDGMALKYMWDFGDGTMQEGGSKATHSYQKGGSYKVKVSVEKIAGSHCKPVAVPCNHDMASTDVWVNTPPVANAGPNLVFCAIKGNAFDGSLSSDADGDALSYSWNFGDGSTASGAKVTHAYAKKGSYKVTLTVDDGSGTDCSMSQDTFTAHVYEKPVPVIKVK